MEFYNLDLFGLHLVLFDLQKKSPQNGCLRQINNLIYCLTVVSMSRVQTYMKIAYYFIMINLILRRGF